MTGLPTTPQSQGGSRPLRRFRPLHDLLLLLVILGGWLAVSYVALPDWWRVREARHPALAGATRLTTTASGIPGDPLNVLFIGSEKQLVAAMLAAGWHPADPVTLRTSVRIAESSVFHRPYEEAPVSDLFLFGRREDLAFEKPVGRDPRERHHVRFWQSGRIDASGRPAWWGAVTFDRSVGFSHTTGQITHHIDPDIDSERDHLILDLKQAAKVGSLSTEAGFQQPEGRNGGGDPWRGDGGLGVVELSD